MDTEGPRSGWRRFRALFARLDRFADALFGYDVFIAYRRKDGEPYARALDQALSARGYSCFVDFREYRPGEPLAAATQRHVGKATVLVVLGTPAILEKREPDWVLAEIETFLAARQGTNAKLVPIDFAGSLLDNRTKSAITEMLSGDFLWQREDTAPALGRPATAVVDAIVGTIGAQRRDRRRLRFFRWLAVIFLALSVASGALALGVVLALRQSEANLQSAKQALSDVFMNEANRRLAELDINGANAFAAAALLQKDRHDARRLILEHPAIEVRTVYPAAEDWGVWGLAYDPAYDRYVVADSDGNLRIIDAAGVKAPEVVATGIHDIGDLTVSTSGTYVAMVHDDDDTFEIRAFGKLREPGCIVRVPEPREPFMRPELVWFDDTRVLILEPSILYVVDAAAPCTEAAPAKLLQNPATNVALAVDRLSSTIFLADTGAIHRYRWMADRLVETGVYELPVPEEAIKRQSVTSLVWLEPAGRLVAIMNERDVVFFGDDLSPQGYSDYLGDFSPPNAFATGRYVVVAPDGAHVYVVEDFRHLASLVFDGSERFSPEFRMPGFAQITPGRGTLAASLTYEAVGGGSVLSIITGQRLGWRLLATDLADSEDGYFSTMAISPNGKKIAVAGRNSVRVVDTASGELRTVASEMGGGYTIAFDPSSKYLAVHDDSSTGIFTTDGEVVHLQLDTSLGSTFPNQVAWLSDGSGVVVRGSYGIARFPKDSSVPLSLVAGTQDSRSEGFGTLPGNRMAYVSDEQLVVWDTASNTFTRRELPLRDGVAIGTPVATPDGALYIPSRVGMVFVPADPDAPMSGPYEQIAGDELMVSSDGTRAVVDGNQIADLTSGEVVARPTSMFDRKFALSPDGKHLYLLTSYGSLYAISLSALDDTAEQLAARVATYVGIGQSDLTITRAGAERAPTY